MKVRTTHTETLFISFFSDKTPFYLTEHESKSGLYDILLLMHLFPIDPFSCLTDKVFQGILVLIAFGDFK